ncbi:MAG: polyphosphate kinase 1 [Myxococcota bacterium]
MTSTEALPRKATPVAVDNPAYFLNRELSLLEFNRRVLAQAQDESIPLLERLRFLIISTTNLDEFFEIRVAGVKQQARFGVTTAGPDGMTPTEQIEAISNVAHGLVEEQYRYFNEVLLGELEKVGIRFLKRNQWKPEVRRWVQDHFLREVLPVLTPVGLDPAHPFPRTLNKSLNFICSLSGTDAFGRESPFAVVQAPRSLPRIVRLPEQLREHPHDFVFLSSIIHANVDDLFPGVKVNGCFQFRLTRNSDLFVDEEEIDDLRHALEDELLRRQHGNAVRLEVADNCPQEMYEFLLEQFELEADDLYRVNGPVNLYRIGAVYDLVDRPDLKFPRFVPGTPMALSFSPDFFETLRRNDIMLHHPFEAFAPVIDFIRQAAEDPDVLAIKQTLYRTGAKSQIVDELINAARNGKEVTVVVELRARFDEEANIDLATRLQEAGANVVYGVVGYKTHAKMVLVVRREGNGLRHYVHLGTGNYHSGTAKAYTDISYLTANRDVGEDVHKVFLQLTGFGREQKLKTLLQSPFTLHRTLLEKIQRCGELAATGKKARIIARMNSLSEPSMIEALYRASQSGVEIDLIVRGICCLRPGIPGVSENVRVRSVIGRFLEHTRAFYFESDEEEVMYFASADWMNRNLFRRVEIAFPIPDPALERRALEETLLRYLDDNCQAWMLQSDGTYIQCSPKVEQSARAAQIGLLDKLAD